MAISKLSNTWKSGSNTFSVRSALVGHFPDLKPRIHLWDRALHPRGSTEEAAKRVRKWYDDQYEAYSYPEVVRPDQERNIPAMQRYLTDKDRHLNKIIEMCARIYLQDLLRNKNIPGRVLIATDFDDVHGGADLIVELDSLQSDGVCRIAVDIAVTNNAEYIDQKRHRVAVCRDYNTYRGLAPNAALQRHIFVIAPRVMARFLASYMDRIEHPEKAHKGTIYSLFQEAMKGVDATKSVVQETVERFRGLMEKN